MNKVPLEHDECVAFADWLNFVGLKFTHIPNETFTKSWNQKRKNKQEGVSSGLPDYMIITPKGLVFVEMKRQTKSASHMRKEQDEWIDALNEIKGVQAKICYGFEQAKEFVEHFL